MATANQPDYEAIKEKQLETWERGDYHMIGTTLQIVSEQLCEDADLRAGSSVLDVCTGTGNTAIAAARRWCRVTGVDYAPALLELAAERARAEHLDVDFETGDAEALPFEDERFDVVTSTFGVQFAPDQAKAAEELVRVCRPGGRIALVNWCPAGFVAESSAAAARYLPPPPGLPSPMRWGDLETLTPLLGGATCLSSEEKAVNYRFLSAAHFADHVRDHFGPISKAFEAAGDQAEALRGDLMAICERFNAVSDGTVIVPATYLTTVFEKA